jgi:hypothetical protein
LQEVQCFLPCRQVSPRRDLPQSTPGRG